MSERNGWHAPGGRFDVNAAVGDLPEFHAILDAQESQRIGEHERDDDQITLRELPCPDILWQGRLAQIADRIGKRSWEVWLGAMCAMGATAQKNLHWQYYRPLYGMLYGLLISPTGQGKGLCTDLCRALLPEHYTVRRSVQSGPALFPILANITKDEKGKTLSIEPRPAMLVIEEWTTLLKVSKIEFSNLQDTLNELFHTPHPFNISRSDTDKSGGDREVQNPTLSICATTTASLLRQEVTERMIRSGFLNRYFVVPGSNDEWKFYDEEQAGISVGCVRGYLDDLQNYAWGAGGNVWSAYAPNAKERIKAWGELTFRPIMRSERLEAESVKRLHTYVHVIALLYAWSEKARLVSIQHVEAAIAAVSISKAFVESLIGEEDIEVPKLKRYEMSLEQKIIDKVQKEPGVSVKKVANDLRASGSYRDLVEKMRRLAKEGFIRLERKGKSETLFETEYKSLH